jgi:hypothetical protein
MSASIRPISPLLLNAIAVWAAWGVSPMPKRSDERVIAQFGAQVAKDLLPEIKSLASDYYAPASNILGSDLSEMAKVASELFREKHPGISEEVVKILAWCFTYNFR